MTAFQSPFAADLERFLVFKRALGHSYRCAEFTLRSFDRYAAEHRDTAASDPAELLRGWLARRTGRGALTVALEFGVLRQFFIHRRRRDPGGFVPDSTWAPWGRGSVFTPHVFTTGQVRQILAAVSLPDAPPPTEPGFRCVFLVLYCTGMRFGETVRLRLMDVDLDRRLLHVVESKGKSRILPFRTDLARELQQYREHRDRRASNEDVAPFFVRADGQALTARRVSDVITAVLRRLGLKPARGRIGPRPYDVRHAFAVHRLSIWHREGVDVNAHLPWLSTYMGHDDLLGTETYLTATPELLAMASRRLRSRLRSARPR